MTIVKQRYTKFSPPQIVILESSKTGFACFVARWLAKRTLEFVFEGNNNT